MDRITDKPNFQYTPSNYNLSETEAFLRSFDDGANHTYQLFDDKGNGGGEHFSGAFDDPKIQQRLIAANQAGRGIFFMVNAGDQKGRSGANVTHIRALMLDLDNAPLDEVYKCKLEPHYIYETSSGRYQCIWLINPIAITDFKDREEAKRTYAAWQTALARKFKGDESIKDLARVMRLPFFFHNKKEPFLTHIIQSNNILPYDIQKLITELGLNPEIESESVKLPSVDLTSVIADGERHDRLIEIAGKYAGRGMAYDEVLAMVEHYNRKLCNPPLNETDDPGEIADIVRYVVEKETIKKKAKPVVIPTESKKPPLQSYIPDVLVDEAPGLVGKIAKHITESAIYPQPALSLASALSLVGILKGHRLRLENPDTRTNVFTLGIAPTGSGKEHPRQYAEKLLKELDEQHSIMGKPVSDAAVRRAVRDRNGKAFLPIDEMGHYVSALTSQKSGNHQKQILALILELFSRATGDYYENEYALRDKDDPREVIHNPHLCVLGFSTPETFFPALSSSHLSDGQLPRWLLFRPEVPRPKRCKTPVSSEPPEDILSECKQILSISTNEAATKNLDFICPRIVSVTPEAQALFEELADTWNDRVEKMFDRNDSCYALWTRAYEHVRKLALIVEDVGVPIKLSTVQWCAKVVSAAIESMESAIKMNIADSPFELDVKAVFDYIKRAGAVGVMKSQLTRKFQRMESRRRADVMDTLIEQGRVSEFTDDSILHTSLPPGRRPKLYKVV